MLISKMINKFFIALFIAATLGLNSLWAVRAESRYFTPYFNMGMSQGAFLPSQGSFFAGANLGMSVGLLTKISENHSLFALYNLGFSGEGFRFPDTAEFSSKDLSHNFNGEYRWQVLPWLRLRPGAGYMMNFTRTAAGEVWGEGLYDTKVTSGQLAADTSFEVFGKDTVFMVQGAYRVTDFPNYTDIIRVFKGLNSQSERLKDQAGLEGTLALTWHKFFSSFRYGISAYKNEKVVESNGTYGNRAQEDTKITLNGGFRGKLWIFETAPSVTYGINRSNQNYLLFKTATDIAPTFQPNYYDYNELGFDAPLYLNFTKKWALSGGLAYKRRDYTQRPPRDGSNAFTSGTQSNNMVTLTAGFRKKINEISSMTLTYTSVLATSNNRFEKYLPYNYSGQGISIGYQLTY